MKEGPEDSRSVAQRPSAICPACLAAAPLEFVEEHVDRIGGRTYRVGLCRECGVVSSEPREPVGADWYEKAAPLRLDAWPSRPDEDWRFARFFEDVRPPARLLDLGCGDGGFLRLARSRGFEGVGFDYDERVVGAARRQGLDVHSARFEDFCASRPSAEFDGLTMFDVLEHVPEPAAYLDAAKRLLKPGGLLALTLPNALRPLPWGREEHDYPPHHFTRWTPGAMKGFLGRRGFEVLRQDCGHLRLRFLADHVFFYRLMPPVLGLAKRVLFGNKAGGRASLSELYERSGADPAPPSGLRAALSDRLLRQRLAVGASRAFYYAFLPVAWGMRSYYRLKEPRGGDCLYTLARLAAG